MSGLLPQSKPPPLAPSRRIAGSAKKGCGERNAKKYPPFGGSIESGAVRSTDGIAQVYSRSVSGDSPQEEPPSSHLITVTVGGYFCELLVSNIIG